MSTIENLEVQIAVIANDIAHIKKDMGSIKKKLENDYVTRTEFEPTKRVVYGLVATVLTGVVGALVGFVLK